MLSENLKLLKMLMIKELGVVVVGAALRKIARGTLWLAESLCQDRKVFQTALNVSGLATNINVTADGYFPPLRTHGDLCSRLLLSGKLAALANEGQWSHFVFELNAAIVLLVNSSIVFEMLTQFCITSTVKFLPTIQSMPVAAMRSGGLLVVNGEIILGDFSA